MEKLDKAKKRFFKKIKWDRRLYHPAGDFWET